MTVFERIVFLSFGLLAGLLLVLALLGVMSVARLLWWRML